MAIPQYKLRNRALSLNESQLKSRHRYRPQGARTAFLSHSHLDRTLVVGLVGLLQDAGLDVYVDWADTSLPPSPNRETANAIKSRIVRADLFLFLATQNSVASRWCPWEIGYADGEKPIDSIWIIPTSEGGTTYGNEYLQLYRRVDEANVGTLARFEPNQHSGTQLRYA